MAQRARIGLFLGKKQYKIFQIAATTRKRHNYIRKILDKNGIWSHDQNFILQVFPREFQKRFSARPFMNIREAIPMSKDISHRKTTLC